MIFGHITTKSKGFTLIEIVIVLAIVISLMAIALRIVKSSQAKTVIDEERQSAAWLAQSQVEALTASQKFTGGIWTDINSMTAGTTKNLCYDQDQASVDLETLITIHGAGSVCPPIIMNHKSYATVFTVQKLEAGSPKNRIVNITVSWNNYLEKPETSSFTYELQVQ